MPPPRYVYASLPHAISLQQLQRSLDRYIFLQSKLTVILLPGPSCLTAFSTHIPLRNEEQLLTIRLPIARLSRPLPRQVTPILGLTIYAPMPINSCKQDSPLQATLRSLPLAKPLHVKKPTLGRGRMSAFVRRVHLNPTPLVLPLTTSAGAKHEAVHLEHLTNLPGLHLLRARPSLITPRSTLW